MKQIKFKIKNEYKNNKGVIASINYLKSKIDFQESISIHQFIRRIK